MKNSEAKKIKKTQPNQVKPIQIPNTDMVIVAENVTDPDIVEAIVNIKSFRDQQKIYIAAIEVAKSVRKKGEFEKIYNQKKNEKISQDRGHPSNVFPEYPEKEYLIPYDTEMDMDGIRVRKEARNAIFPVRIAAAPVYINAIIADRSDPMCPQKYAELKFFNKNRQKWETAIVPEEIITDASKIKGLGGIGVLFDPGEAKSLAHFFYQLRVLNVPGSPHPIAEYNSITKLGWRKQQDGTLTFVPYDSVEGMRYMGRGASADMYRGLAEPKGTMDAWLSVVKPAVLKNVQLRVFMDAAIASVLVRITQALPFVTHLFGKTGTGKTVALSMAASIWGPPHPQTGGFIGSWETTKAGIEIKADLLSDLPILLDDTAKAERQFSDFSGFIYELASGTGKTRATKTLHRQKDRTWQSTTLSTGEHPIVSQGMQGGAIIRVVSIEIKNPPLDRFSDVQTIYENYGHAGRIIINFIKEIGADFFRSRKNHYAELITKRFSSDGIDTTKQAQSLALLAVADEIFATQVLGIKPLTVDDFEPFYTGDDAVDENVQAYDVLKTIVLSQKKQHFFEDHTSIEGDKEVHHSMYPSFDLWGRFIDEHYDNETVTIDIIPRIFKKIIKDAKYDPTMFLKWLDSRKLLTHESGRMTCRRSLQPGEKKMRVYEIDLKLDDFDSEVSDDDDDVPDDLPY